MECSWRSPLPQRAIDVEALGLDYLRGDDRASSGRTAHRTEQPHLRGWRAGAVCRLHHKYGLACAGMTCTRGTRVGNGTARLRRDDWTDHCGGPLARGTALPARGRRQVAQPGLPAGRGRPACAGTTVDLIADLWRPVGTAPPAQGRHQLRVPADELAGNSPACAGTTTRFETATTGILEQPRLRGDDVVPAGLDDEQQGNSPACAGTTGVPADRTAVSWEQPRMRGDDLAQRPLRPTLPGTAPHARGRRPGAARRPGPRGNSPACAGTTRPRPSGSARTPEQPRMRGDDERGSK